MAVLHAADEHASAIADSGWEARLRLHFERRGARTVLSRLHHFGPLRVQKPLYPESPMRADVLVLHPPAGIAGGDILDIELHAGAGAQARLTTPGAAKWYRSRGPLARQATRLHVADDAALEWLPQENIVFDGARVDSRLHIDAAPRARLCGWDLWMLGRRTAGERFTRGEWRQCTELRHGGRLTWAERVRLDAGDPIFDSPLGWNGARAIGSLWALGLPADDSLLDACRAVRAPGVHLGITRFGHGLWLARALGESVERLRGALTRVWLLLRGALCGAPPLPPRIWAT